MKSCLGQEQDHIENKRLSLRGEKDDAVVMQRPKPKRLRIKFNGVWLDNDRCDPAKRCKTVLGTINVP